MAAKIVLPLLLASHCLGAPQYPVAETYAYQPPVYTYQYAVNDLAYSGSVFSAQESRNDLTANGDYKVALPDGRTQIVTYSVNGPEGGYIADVQYEGEAAYPEAVIKAAPVQTVVQPAVSPIAISKPVFHSAPLVVAPTSLRPVVHTSPLRPIVHTSPLRPVIHASPIVFHPAPVPTQKAQNGNTVNDIVNIKTSDTKEEARSSEPKEELSNQEERRAKEALIVEEPQIIQITSAINESPSPVVQNSISPVTIDAPTVKVEVIPTTQEVSTPPPPPPTTTVPITTRRPVLPIVTPTVAEVETIAPVAEVETPAPVAEVKTPSPAVAESQRYYFRFL